MKNSVSLPPRQAGEAIQALQALLEQKVTGQFLVTAESASPLSFSRNAPRTSTLTWLLYCTQGKLNFVTSAVRSRSRLQYLLHHYAPNLPLPDWDAFAGDYDYLCSVLTTQQLGQQGARQLLSIISVEALSQILAAAQLTITQSSETVQLEPLLISLNFADLLPRLQVNLQSLQLLHPEIPSLFDCPVIPDAAAFARLIAAQPEASWLSAFQQQIAPGRCFYAIADLNHQAVLGLAQRMKPLIKQGLVSTAGPDSRTNRPATVSEPTPFRQAPISPSATSPSPISPPPPRAPLQQTPLPLETASAMPQVAPPAIAANSIAASAPNQYFKIACVDDSPTILKEIENCLSGGVDEFSIFPIVNSVQALMWLRRIQPDLVLMDVGMPGVNGYDLCQLIRGNPQFAEIPIIMVTGNTSALDRQRAMQVGASDYLTKPFTQKGLLDMVKRHLKLSATELGR
jgi:two-component system, chemotaxis family, response regulator PixG